MRNLTTVAELLGVALIASAGFMVALPLGLLVSGAGLIAVSVAVERGQ